jgi:para-nitrobenzyl esterase
VGALRWQKPQPPASWEGVRAAKTFAARAWQMNQEPGSLYQKEFFNDEDFLPPMSEDCLYLNVWTPAAGEGEKLPVAFWIHGGAYINGFSSEMEFDGAAYARQGVVLVSVNYRLGALGFLTHPWLRDGEDISGNYGLYDVLAALDWVRENIAAFGGDGNCVTVFGQSAGAMAAQALVSSKLCRGKIQRAIFQSGGGYRGGFGRNLPREKMEEFGALFVDAAGVSSKEELLALPVEKLFQAQTAVFMKAMRNMEGGLPFAPHADGILLEDDGDAILSRGGHLDIPYLLGGVANDMGIPPGGDPREGPIHRGCVSFSLLQEELGRRAAYVYLFSQKPRGDDSGAFHSSELWYMFGTLGRSWRPVGREDYALSSRMVSYWCNFIKHGDPNGPGLPEWKPCAGDEQFVMELEEGTD